MRGSACVVPACDRQRHRERERARRREREVGVGGGGGGCRDQDDRQTDSEAGRRTGQIYVQPAACHC